MSSHISVVGLSLPENEEYCLPSWRNVNDQAMKNHDSIEHSKKRDLDDFLATSSDPPLFSSDDVPSSAENYTQPRSKRQRKGPWWSGPQAVQPSHRQKRGGFTRNIDSAVWMGSDASEEELMDSEGGLVEATRCQQEVDHKAMSMKDDKPTVYRNEPLQEDECFELALKYIEVGASDPPLPLWLQPLRYLIHLPRDAMTCSYLRA